MEKQKSVVTLHGREKIMMTVEKTREEDKDIEIETLGPLKWYFSGISIKMAANHYATVNFLAVTLGRMYYSA